MIQLFQLSVHQYKNKLQQLLGWADPVLVQRYAEARKAWKQDQVKPPATSQPTQNAISQPDPAAELAYQEGVLERMKTAGCKSCEAKAQARHVERLRAALDITPT